MIKQRLIRRAADKAYTREQLRAMTNEELINYLSSLNGTNTIEGIAAEMMAEDYLIDNDATMAKDVLKACGCKFVEPTEANVNRLAKTLIDDGWNKEEAYERAHENFFGEGNSGDGRPNIVFEIGGEINVLSRDNTSTETQLAYAGVTFTNDVRTKLAKIVVARDRDWCINFFD